MKNRVVITGLGPVSSIGIGKEEFWNNAVKGKGYFRNIDFNDVEIEQFKSRICSPIDNLDISKYMNNTRKLRKAGKASIYSLIGACLALKDAGFKIKEVDKRKDKGPNLYYLEGIDPFRAGVIIGQSAPNGDVEYPEHIKFIRDKGPKYINPFTLPQSNINTGSSMINEWFFLKGTGFTISTACSSAIHAIGMAALSIQNGLEDIIVTGGTDAAIDSYIFAGFDVIRALSKRNNEPMKASRPFDRDRDGFVLGEGAGIIVLEELEHAKRRGAKLYAELVGFGYASDAYNVVAPEPYGSSAIFSIKKALAMGKISPEEVEYINAHGTSTVLNDPNESYIIKQVFGDYAYKIPVSSSKSYFGHALGAAGGLESIVTILTMEYGIITPTINLECPDINYIDKNTPDLDKRCDLDYVQKVKRKKSVNIALKESFGFGGQNGVLLFKKYEE